MNKCLALLIAVLAYSCSQQNGAMQATTLEKYSFDEVIEQHLTDASAWPEFGIERANEMIELFDMVELGGAIGQRAQRRVNRLSNNEIQHALLLIVETDKQNTALRRRAYNLLANRDWQSSNRFIPRLTLRLKYEKDWPSNIIIARALANVGSLAGLSAVQSILLNSSENEIDDLDLAKSLAAEFISEIILAMATLKATGSTYKCFQTTGTACALSRASKLISTSSIKMSYGTWWHNSAHNPCAPLTMPALCLSA